MEWLDSLPVGVLALLIFCLRIFDVSLGTVRTIAVVQGRSTVTVLLGFIEVLVWVTTVTHVVQRATGNPVLLVAYAGGFAAGNAVGIAVEKRLALGAVIVRFVSQSAGQEVAELLKRRSPKVFQFEGREHLAPVTLIYVPARRRDARRLIKQAMEIDPSLYYAVDSVRESNWNQPSPALPTGWRSVAKKK
ncbi:hypothetical protein Pla123a_38210 [Posidoniimonas polymericola]|uniref:DUF5698 domain-containing protein n=1 Tax=Posidoniimonas polymericola TaxID=2528002 RepID=A0A5C5YGG2_9BACT|nr:DUF5698 domain-containing protein [Posidoniimonas polymericola]TWT73485.1 hypothetical protein Pla123a_38210 [Posidoniimonas polymericola]